MRENTISENVLSLGRSVQAELERVIQGQSAAIQSLLVAFAAGGHVLLEGVPGVAKTLLARSLAASLRCTFSRIQFTPDLMPSDITGIHYYNQKSGEFEFRAGPIIAQIVLADEINRATPRTQSALLEAMAERQVTIDEATIPLPAPFLVIATQNPIELEGTFPLPEAQLDRFLLCLRLGYPEESEEEEMLLRFEGADPLADLKPVTTAQEVLGFQSLVQKIYVDPVLRNYLVKVVQATRRHSEIELGASPRATIGLYRCSQALAAIRGREYVTPDEVKTLAPYALAHRVILKSQARLRERDAQSIVNEVLGRVEVPV
jgi:MoxR-like ATPase